MLAHIELHFKSRIKCICIHKCITNRASSWRNYVQWDFFRFPAIFHSLSIKIILPNLNDQKKFEFRYKDTSLTILKFTNENHFQTIFVVERVLTNFSTLFRFTNVLLLIWWSPKMRFHRLTFRNMSVAYNFTKQDPGLTLEYVVQIWFATIFIFFPFFY